ncbi:MAG: TonB-dependent receptor [Acidobacteriia bacterium]|nr:TonB-dependent receptor [Terriglobia bacterium]
MRPKFTSAFLKTIGVAAGLALFIVLLAPTSLYAQSTGTVTGTVYDQAGAVVPKATVQLTNDATGDTRKSTSNDAGYFSFGGVQPGAYSVKVSASGFKGWQQSGIPVRPGDLRDISGISLQVGAQGETVQVEAVAAEVAPVDSGERSAVLTSKQIENMALLGRDATDLIRTLPGFAAYNGGGLGNHLAQDPSIVSPTSGAVGENYVGGGNLFRGGSDLIMDGAHILDNGCNCGATATVNGDMVSEVKVQTSNFGADSAKGPLVVNVIGKSGTTSYHGEAYLHARDASLDSLDWSFKHQMLSSPPGLVTPAPVRFMYPGFQFGGPVPGTNKKVVFTSAFEYYYQNGVPLQGITVPGLLTNNVPTLSMRAGDFSTTGSNSSPGSSTVADNADLCSGLGYPSNWSPLCGDMGFSSASNPIALDPGALALMGQVPLPNADPTKTGGYNLLVPENLNQNGWMWRTRVDYAITDSTKLYVTYQVQKETDNVPVHLWWQPTNSVPFPGGMSSKDNSQTLSGHFLKVVNPTLTNDLSIGIGYINYPLIKNSKTAWTTGEVGYPYAQAFPNNASNWAPDFGNGYWLSGMPQMIQPDIFETGCKSGTPCNAPFVWQKWNYSLEDSVTKVYKTHTIKAGFYWEKTTNNQGAFSDYNGHFEAETSGNPHTNPVANFLMGYAGYDQVNKYALDNLWYPTYSGYVQDDWKFNKRLTLNLGLRADHLGEWRTPSGAGVATFIGDPNSAANNPSGSAPGFNWHGLSSSIPVTGRNVATITWEPRLGMALDLRGNGKTVLRGGWGEYGYRDQWNDYQNPTDLAQGVRTYNPGLVVMGNSIPGGPIGINSISGTVDPTNLGCGPGASSGLSCGNLNGFALTDHQQPITRSYNFTVSQQVPWSSLLEIGYVGSQTLYASVVGNTNNLDARGLNVIPLGGLFTFSGCSSPLSSTDANCDIGRKYSTGNGGVVNGATGAYTLGSAYSNNVAAVTQHIGKADYNGLQVSWVRQKGRLTYNLNYTWSKALGTLGTAQLNGANADGLNLANDYGVLSIDRSHVVNMSYTLQTGNPIKNRALAYALNGWTLSGITTYQSGGNISTQQDGQTNLNLGGNGPLSGNIQTDPNNCPIVNGSHLPSCEQSYGINAMNWLGTNNVVLQPTITCNPTANLHAHQFFNANCFSVSAPGEQGWLHLPYIHAPAYFNSDLAVFKTFKVTERQNVEFRLSAFNFLNHPLDSFQGGNGDNRIGLNYVGTDPAGNACGTSADIVSTTTGYCPLGSGSWVSTADTSATSPGKAVHPGYASTRFGRRIVELSVKYRF